MSVISAPVRIRPLPLWGAHIAALAVALAVLGMLYAGPVTAAIAVWWVSPTYSHCFLILPVSAYLIWQKRRDLAAHTPQANPSALWLAIPVAAAALLGKLAAVNEIEQLAVVGFAQVFAAALLGWAVYRTIAFALLFLFFLVPMGEYLIGPLQHFTTLFIDRGLTLLGILHFTEGNLIELANGKYEVAEACAGLRFLIATVAVGALFSYLSYRKPHKVILFMAACVIVPIIANGFRALGIVLLAHFSNNQIAVGADHLIYGWGFSVVILALLMFAGARYADPEVEAPLQKRAESVRPPTPRVLGATLAAALVLAALVPAFAAYRAQQSPSLAADRFSAPPVLAGWTVTPPSADWALRYQAPDARLAFALAKQDAVPVDVAAAYYGEGGRNLISSQNKLWDERFWHPVSQGEAVAPLGGESIRWREDVIARGGLTRLIWSSYVSGGVFTQSAFAVKRDRIRTALWGGEGSALFAVSTMVDGDPEAARARLRLVLAELAPVKARLTHGTR